MVKITKKALLAAGYTEYNAEGATGDPHCVGYFQKVVGKRMLNVSFWRFTLKPAGVQQVNFESIVPFGANHLDVGLRGVPETWSVADLERYFLTICTLGGCTDTVLKFTTKRTSEPKRVKRQK